MLKHSNPAISLRDYQLNEGYLKIDPRTLTNLNELDIIYKKMIEIIKEIK
ncbi:hypothetical protein [Spiroplasma sp. ChiS]|nr:hypothetical protein [Spiroplasma sp. ChiS]